MFELKDYHYTLPDSLIAHEPTIRRDDARLMRLCRHSGAVEHLTFSDLPSLLHPGDVLIVNNTRVVPGRLYGKKETGGQVEVLVTNYAEARASMAEGGAFEPVCLIRASKAPRPGSVIHFDDFVSAEVLLAENGTYRIRFSMPETPEDMLGRLGQMPLPPYIRRESGSTEADAEDYQTVYARHDGAVAAPTAGLHFTDALLNEIRANGVAVHAVTLHVGYGTFSPVRVTDIREHRMHSESFFIPEETARAVAIAKKEGRRVVAVGTTSVRTLEYAARQHGSVVSCSGACDLFIYPGFRFEVVDAIITNFHLPESTLLMLVSAFASRERILDAYAEAVRNGYRFFSYGDAMMIA